MISDNQIDDVQRATVYDRSGDKIGKAGQVYLDDATGAPSWVTVNTGLFGTSESFVPLESATLNGDRLEVAYEKDLVKDAPRVAADGHLEVSEEAQLYRHYGLSDAGDSGYAETTTGTAGGTGTGYEGTAGTAQTEWAGRDSTEGTTRTEGEAGLSGQRDDSTVGTGVGAGAGAGGTGSAAELGGREAGGVDRSTETVGRDTSGPTTDDAMTRSEERLNVGTEQVQTGRARLRKYVTTEQQTVTVPVTREEVRVEREPITEGNADAALSGPDLSDEEHEVVLTEERPVVSKETVPVERVRLDKETVTDEQQVTDEVRKEEIDVDSGTRRD
jgi:uncharacterized protein (TIGR02271 family)